MVSVKTMARGKRGMFYLCTDDTNGRIYFRRDGSDSFRRYNAPPDSGVRESLTVGKRGVFVTVRGGESPTAVYGSVRVWFRPFRGGAWRTMRTPR